MAIQKTPSLTPWLRRDQWTRFCEVFAGDDPLPPSYDHWLRASQRGVVDLSRAGYNVQRVEIDVDALVAWCRQQNRKVDPVSMMLFSRTVAGIGGAEIRGEATGEGVTYTEKTFSLGGPSGPKVTIHVPENPN